MSFWIPFHQRKNPIQKHIQTSLLDVNSFPKIYPIISFKKKKELAVISNYINLFIIRSLRDLHETEILGLVCTVKDLDLSFNLEHFSCSVSWARIA